MAVWDNVTSVTDIKLYYDFGEPSANIYGNERNCVALNIAFNAKKATELVDLSGQDLSKHVQLINYESSKPLGLQFRGTNSNQLYYNKERSDFVAQLMVQPQASQLDKVQMRATVTFYVYAKAESDFTSNIAVRFLLSSGNIQDTSADRGFPQKLNIRVFRPSTYSVDDVSPLEWHFTRELDDAKLDNAYIRPKDSSRFWKKNEFVPPGSGGLKTFLHASMQDDGCHVFLISELGWPVDQESNLFGRKIPLVCNQEDGAFSMMKLFLKPPFHQNFTKLIDINSNSKNTTSKVLLYDQFGNLGSFAFNWDDPSNPKLISVRPFS